MSIIKKYTNRGNSWINNANGSLLIFYLVFDSHGNTFFIACEYNKTVYF